MGFGLKQEKAEEIFVKDGEAYQKQGFLEGLPDIVGWLIGFGLAIAIIYVLMQIFLFLFL